jgi:hypothetical protein
MAVMLYFRLQQLNQLVPLDIGFHAGISLSFVCNPAPF